MIEKIILTKDDERQIYDCVDKGRFGDCYHDIYLNLLGDLISTKYNPRWALTNPIIVFDKNYHFKGNDRRIEDANDRSDDSKMVFAYFAHPIPSSPLYLAILKNKMIFPLTRAAGIIGAKCDSTGISGTPFTLRVDMIKFADIWDNHKKDVLDRCTNNLAVNENIIMSSKLKYVSDRINSVDDLFDVIRFPYNI